MRALASDYVLMHTELSINILKLRLFQSAAYARRKINTQKPLGQWFIGLTPAVIFCQFAELNYGATSIICSHIRVV